MIYLNVFAGSDLVVRVLLGQWTTVGIEEVGGIVNVCSYLKNGCDVANSLFTRYFGAALTATLRLDETGPKAAAYF